MGQQFFILFLSQLLLTVTIIATNIIYTAYPVPGIVLEAFCVLSSVYVDLLFPLTLQSPDNTSLTLATSQILAHSTSPLPPCVPVVLASVFIRCVKHPTAEICFSCSLSLGCSVPWYWILSWSYSLRSLECQQQSLAHHFLIFCLPHSIFLLCFTFLCNTWYICLWSVYLFPPRKPQNSKDFVLFTNIFLQLRTVPCT